MHPLRIPIAWEVDKNGCWNCTSHRTSSGYPVTVRYRKRVRIHRMIFEECFGPIPDGMFVCHHCDNRRCINPEHLFLGTDADNMHDAASKKRPIGYLRNFGVKLSPDDVRVIRSSNESQRLLAKRFGVHFSNISAIKLNKSWRWVKCAS